MDKYLFKAKDINTGKWVIWDIFSGVNDSNIDKSTICQCTGLRDKSGNLIYEKDEVFVTDNEGCSGQVDTGFGEIDFLGGLWYISGTVQNALYDINNKFQIEVVGNILDNIKEENYER